MIAFDVEGPPEAPAMVLCSSLGATTASWAAQREALRDGLRVVSVETRGHVICEHVHSHSHSSAGGTR